MLKTATTVLVTTNTFLLLMIMVVGFNYLKIQLSYKRSKSIKEDQDQSYEPHEPYEQANTPINASVKQMQDFWSPPKEEEVKPNVPKYVDQTIGMVLAADCKYKPQCICDSDCPRAQRCNKDIKVCVQACDNCK